jgi:hypothetical protein
VAFLSVSALVTLSACGPNEPAATESTTTPSPLTSVTVSPSPTSSDQADLEALYTRFWDATVTAYAGPDTSPDLWRGLVTEEVAQQQIALTQEYADHNVTYSGEPRLVSLDVQITGDTALLAGCMDHAQWVATSTTEELPPRGTGVYPSVLTAQRIGGAWVVTSDAGPTEGVSC